MLALCSTLAAAGLAGCRGDGTDPGVGDQGHFFVNVSGHGNKSYEGTTAFMSTFEDGAEILTFAFIAENEEFELVFSIRDFRGEPGLFNVSESPDGFSGSFAYVVDGERVQYAIDGGTFTIETVSRFLIVGELNLVGTATEGASDELQGNASGTFRAACEGECVGGGGPPPGS